MLLSVLSKKKTCSRSLSLLLCLLLALSMFPMPAFGAGVTGALIPEKPVLLVTGTDLIGGSLTGAEYTAANISYEKSYTLDELKSMTSVTRLYSSLNSSLTKRIYTGEGVDAAELLALSGYSADTGGNLTFLASDGYSASFSPSISLNTGRLCYPNFGAITGETEGAQPAPAMLAWKTGYVAAPGTPALTTDENPLRLLVGQTAADNQNNGLFNQRNETIQAGSAIAGIHITVLGAAYTRAEILMMPRAERSYTYGSSGGDKTDLARGVPLAVLLDGADDNDVIEFTAADGYTMPSNMTGLTKSDLAAGNAILAYETFESPAWQGIYSTAKSNAPNPAGIGYFTLYIDGLSPAKMICDVSAKPASASRYKHINYPGAPYNVDAITGATLTVEGPGVINSVPITVRQIEETADNRIHSGVYADLRGGVSTERRYEGVKVLSILDGLVNSNVIPLDDNVEVVFKNRWRQEVSRMSYGEIKNAVDPVILAYGTAFTNESAVAPFVFNLAAGIVTGLGNDDGPLKLVYNQGAYPGAQFSSVAYMYVEEGEPPPGFKHTTAANDAYNNVLNTEYILTFTGDELGREVNYTIRELEEMADADATLSHRDEYSLSNTTYWYVNEYEGIKLWDLLVRMGVDEAKADKGPGSNDSTPLVSFSAWDNYQISSQFSFYQLAHPELFYFYEKSPLDIGTDRPAKEQLATPEYQPDNQVGTWTRDSNNYPVKTGYPVLLAYGVNSYPYVRNSGMDGYKSGLGNSGGPMRLIYGKADGLNRADPAAEENYAYFFNNGSQQLQRLQEIYVGNGIRYSAHLENPDPAYQEMKDQQALTVEIVAGGSAQTVRFTLAELESILYGAGVSKRDRDNDGRQEKGYYAYRNYNGSPLEDLFEGVNLEYLLTEVVGLQGSLGTVELYSGSNGTASAVYDLRDISERGYNSERGTSGLGMMVAFAKNGYPLVSGGGTTPGYVSTDPVTGKDIKNNGGPLQFVRGQTAVERDAGTVDESNAARASVTNLTRIVVNLDPDPYAHIGSEYDDLAGQQIMFSGAVAKAEGVSLTIGALETKQTYIIDGEYTIDGNTDFYRGLDLYALLYNKDIGASALMSEITVKNEEGESKTLTFDDLTGSGKKTILAYGSGAGDNAKPLSIAGGGPMRLVIDGGTEADCIMNVSRIEVSAASIAAWKHNFGVYAQYASQTLEISGQNLTHNKTYTVAELEAMDNNIIQDSYKVGSNTVVVQGVELYKLLQNIGFAGGMDSSVFSVYASDGYSPGSFTASQLKDGINGKPILVAFGQGTTAATGLPLVPYDNSPGYDSTADNQSGPLRLMIHDNSGWSVKFLTRIVVGAAGGNPDPELPDDFGFTLYPGGVNGLPMASVRAVVPDGAGGTWIGTNGAGAAYISSTGEITAYTTGTTPALKTDFITGIAIAPDGGVWMTQGGSVGSQNAPPTAHYGFTCLKNGEFTFYDTTSLNSALPNDCVYGIDVDKDGVVWIATQHTLLNGGMEGGLTKFDPFTNEWRTWTMEDGLPTLSAWAVKSDGAGGAWVTTYRTSNVSDTDWPDESYAHVSAAGVVTSYPIPAGNDLTWSRSVAVAPDGGVYITRMSGAHDPANTGGWLDYIAPDGKVTSYSGDSLIPELKSEAHQGFYPEIRTVFIDAEGNLWLTTNGLGVYKRAVSPSGDVVVLSHYWSGTRAWPAGAFDDVWSVFVLPDGNVSFGSNGGVAAAVADLTPPADKPIGGDPQDPAYIGDATPSTAQFRITGAVEKPGYFTVDGLKTYPGVAATTKTYNWLNSYGSTGRAIMTGVYLETLLKNVIRMAPDAASVTVTASDGYERSFNLDSQELGAYWTDNDGNKLMLAWSGSGDRGNVDPGTLRLVVGQKNADDINLSSWVSGVVSITVNAAPVTPGSGSPGNYDGAVITDEQAPTASWNEQTVIVAVTLPADVTVDNGSVTAANTAEAVESALAELGEKAADQAGAGKVLKVDAATGKQTERTTYTLPADALSALIDDGRTTLSLITDQGGITLSAELLKYLDSAGHGPLVIEIAASDSLETGGLMAVEVEIRIGDTVINDFNGLLLKMEIPFDATDFAQTEGLVVYYVGENGQKSLIKLAAYDAASGSIKIGLLHLSKYIIGFDQVTFADIREHWARGSIEFLASRGIVNGRSVDTFDPKGTVTRAEFVKMLAESADGAGVLTAPAAGFSDVKDSDWYAGYVNWAVSVGIVQGYPDGTFRPNSQITREQMAIMLARFIQIMKVSLFVTQSAADFTDRSLISPDAADSVAAMRRYGILNGYPDGSFDPKGTASRAEAAKAIRVCIEAILR